MGLFDIFKKKEERHYDPNNIKITDLRKGFFVDYDMKTWQVTAEYEYDWGSNFFTYEYKLDSGDESVFLTVAEDDELEMFVCKKVNVRAIDEDLPEFIEKNEFPPKKLTYKGVTYFKDSENAGYFRDLSTKDDEGAEFISWDYFDESQKLVLSIEQWGEREFDAAYGKMAKEFEFSNFVPGK